MSLNDYKINTFSKPVSALADRPRITAAELKAWFDSNSTNEIKTSINSLIDALVALTGADQIGVSVEGIAQQTVFGVLTALKVLIDDRYTIAQTDSRLLLKFDDSNAHDLVKTVNIDRQTGVFTVTKYDGTVETWDTAIEKVAIDAKLDGTDFVLTLVDGTEQRVSLSAFVDTYNFITSDTIQVIETVGNSSKSYTFNIRPGSIKTEMMDPQLLTTITGYVESASASAARAARSAESALTSKQDAVSSAAAALTSEHNAAQSEANALLYKTAAEESAASVETSATEAAESAKSALASKTAAANSATAALSSETKAKASETAAATAKVSAEASQTAASTSAVEAANSAASALASKNAAATSATNASASETKAKASETAALTSQTSAASSADRAEEAAKRAENIAGLEVVVKSDIINDLTSGGVEKVLSAEQGKILQTNKVDKVSGKGLSSNDYTTAEKSKLAGLSNYNDAQIKADITSANNAIGQLQTRVESIDNSKVDKVSGKGLSANDYTTAEKNKLAGLSNYDDTELRSDVEKLKQYPINEALTLLAANWSSSTPATYTVTDNRYTAAVSDWDIRPGVNMTEAETDVLSAADIDIDGSHDGYFVLTANGDKPTIDLPILIKIWRL